VLGFFVVAVNPATIIATVRHADLRQGSGNPGATNVGRVLGVRWGVVVGVLDVLKGLVPTLLALWLGDRFTAYGVGLATVLGTCCPRFCADEAARASPPRWEPSLRSSRGSPW